VVTLRNIYFVICYFVVLFYFLCALSWYKDRYLCIAFRGVHLRGYESLPWDTGMQYGSKHS